MELHPEQKIAGVLAPLFALRGSGDTGIGDLAALREMAEWCLAHEIRLLQILPVNETGPDNSPYNAISASALDPTTITTTPQALKDLDESRHREVLAGFDVDSLCSGPVDYPRVKALKLALLRAAHAEFLHKLAKGTGRAGKFRHWCKRNAFWLEGYTLFRVLMERNGTEMWDTWPTEQQTAIAAELWLHNQDAGTRGEFAAQREFYAYAQWIAHAQWSDFKKWCDKHGMALMGDIPFGVSYYSADVFSHPQLFDAGWSGGAPPERIFQTDPFTAKWGQNWGVPLYCWSEHEATGFEWWKNRVSLVREVFHLFRVDHILGFYRIYAFPWRPQQNADFLDLEPWQAAERTGGRLPGFHPRGDDRWEDAEANRLGGERILRVLVDAAGPHRLIGEDLGVVPDYVRPSLSSLGIAGFKIPMWEKGWDGHFIPGDSYQRLSISTFATHDHPPVSAFWNEWADLLARAEQGDSSAMERADGARWEMRQMMQFAGIDAAPGPVPYSDFIRESLLAALFRSNSWLAVPMITDFFGSAGRFNVPGAVDASNWSNRLPESIGAWWDHPVLAPRMQRVAEFIRQSGRAL